jgi:hypothetical protein
LEGKNQAERLSFSMLAIVLCESDPNHSESYSFSCCDLRESGYFG